MHKLDGLRFLRRIFGDMCVDCVFIDPKIPLRRQLIIRGNKALKLFRVRSGRQLGSELNCPQKTCHSVEEIAEFIGRLRAVDNTLDFLVHRVGDWYFKPDFVGTIALFEGISPEMVIELQVVSRELVAKIDTGLRPRDWKVAATFIYPFSSGSPRVNIVDRSFNANVLKEPIYQLWNIGREIDLIKISSKDSCDTAARFNIYPSGRILLDDYRSWSSFGGKP